MVKRVHRKPAAGRIPAGSTGVLTGVSRVGQLSRAIFSIKTLTSMPNKILTE
jgi:hypothetical protein